MAKATVEKKIIVKEVSENIITLTLSQAEGQLLRDILGRTGGSLHTRRALNDSIFRALEDFTSCPLSYDFTGSITFKE